MCSSLSAEPISIDDIKVKDGDTIYVHNIEFRMIGYDSPETKNGVKLIVAPKCSDFCLVSHYYSAGVDSARPARAPLVED
jgi:hypothetical protein